MLLNMLVEVGSIITGIVAPCALVRFLPRVNEGVLLQIIVSAK